MSLNNNYVYRHTVIKRNSPRLSSISPKASLAMVSYNSALSITRFLSSSSSVMASAVPEILRSRINSWIETNRFSDLSVQSSSQFAWSSGSAFADGRGCVWFMNLASTSSWHLSFFVGDTSHLYPRKYSWRV